MQIKSSDISADSQYPPLSLLHRVKQHRPLSWFPALEKHDIPIVVGVGVSLTFIFITMAFYSLVQKNDPALAGRGGEVIACGFAVFAVPLN